MTVADQYARWMARKIRSLGQVPCGTPLVWQAARLYGHSWRLAQAHRHAGAGVSDALAVLSLSTSIYHDAHWDGVREAVQAGATVGQVAMALGISIDDARDLIRRIKERDRELKRYFQQASP
ncbi:hypothetical protein [Streptomyces sp. NPDC093589]|uniref:hypothetical protein n=1 Tax=Streptomyces sp. NPDC093589 TaxID=3366043 RepID=UPI00381F61C7